MGEIAEVKAELRSRLQKLKAELPSRAAIDEAIIKNLIALPEYCEAGEILTYISRADEVSTVAIINHALRSGKRVFAPAVKEDEMEFYSMPSIEELAIGKFGILEPDTNEAGKIAETKHALCITPAIACDRRFFRLGFGGGYYDKFLANNDVISCGLCYEMLLYDELPAESHDERLKLIVTEKAVYRRS